MEKGFWKFGEVFLLISYHDSRVGSFLFVFVRFRSRSFFGSFWSGSFTLHTSQIQNFNNLSIISYFHLVTNVMKYEGQLI